MSQEELNLCFQSIIHHLYTSDKFIKLGDKTYICDTNIKFIEVIMLNNQLSHGSYEIISHQLRCKVCISILLTKYLLIEVIILHLHNWNIIYISTNISSIINYHTKIINKLLL